MPFKSLITLLVLGTASVAGADVDVLPSPGTTFTPYGAVAGWRVFVNEDRMTCMIEKRDADGNVVQMGLTADRGFGYLGVFTRQDIGLAAGEESIAVVVGDNVYVGTARMITSGLRGGYQGGYIVTDDPQFVTDVMQSNELVALPETEFTVVINLDGTMNAIEAARDCTAAQAD